MKGIKFNNPESQHNKSGRVMFDIRKEVFEDPATVRKIQAKLPFLFQLAELESQRGGKIGMVRLSVN